MEAVITALLLAEGGDSDRKIKPVYRVVLEFEQGKHGTSERKQIWALRSSV